MIDLLAFKKAASYSMRENIMTEEKISRMEVGRNDRQCLATVSVHYEP